MNKKTIHFHEQAVTIQEPYYSQPLTAFPFKSCATLINHLTTFLNVQLLGELPMDFTALPFHVSEKKIIKFFEQLIQFTFISPPDQFTLLFSGMIIQIPETLLAEQINPHDYETCPIVIQRLQEQNVFTYDQLPAQLDSLTQLRSIGHKAVEKFVEHLQYVMQRHSANLVRLSQIGTFS
ncbi:MAG: hypothetical protein ACRC3A_05710, partial [Culicoidibacterales bacterium]